MKCEFSPISGEEIDRMLAWLAGKEHFVLFETLKGDADNHRSLLFTDPERLIECDREGEAAAYLAELDRALAEGKFVAGHFAYEFGYLLEARLAGKLDRGMAGKLASFGVFAEPVVIDHCRAAYPRPWDETSPLDEEPHRISDLRLNTDHDEYLAAIGRIKGYIEAGDTYQVNYTLKYLFDFDGSPLSLYRALRRRQSVAYAALIRNGEEWIISLSPELFFRVKGNRCTVKPMKGTCGRGRTGEEDRQLAARLAADRKNRSENVMIVDLLRNDLGRLCVAGGVVAEAMFEVEPFETLQQMTSTVSGELRPGTGAAEVIRALFPCGSVTGAPKLRTMEIIHELEAGERGVYTGAIGWWGPKGESCFNVPIRTVVLDGPRGEMGIGSGIIYDSDPEDEWRESLLKGDFLTGVADDFRLIETMSWSRDHGVWLLDAHLARLASSARYFNFSFDYEGIMKAVEGLARDLPTGGKENCFRIRLLLDRDGGVECGALAWSPPNLVADRSADPVKVAWAGRPSDSASPFFYHKTTRRELYDQALDEARGRGLFDLLFCNERGEVTEGAISNIFVLAGDELLTPPVACGLLAGVLREKLLRDGVRLADGRVLPLREKVMGRGEVERAEAIFLGNSVRGLTRVELEVDERSGSGR